MLTLYIAVFAFVVGWIAAWARGRTTLKQFAARTQYDLAQLEANTTLLTMQKEAVEKDRDRLVGLRRLSIVCDNILAREDAHAAGELDARGNVKPSSGLAPDLVAMLRSFRAPPPADKASKDPVAAFGS